MNNFWFYWVMWGLWLIAAFFLKAGKPRTWICVSLLVVITCSPFSFIIDDFSVNYGFIAMVLIGCTLLSSESFGRVIFLTIASLIIMMADVLAQIYWLYDPAILILLPKWTFIILLGSLVFSLTMDFWKRIAIILIGMSQGEILQSLVFYPFDKTVGDSDYLVTVSFLILLTVGWELFAKTVALLKMATERSTQQRIPK